MVHKVEETSTSYETNGIYFSFRFLKHFAVQPSPVVVEALTKHADAMLEFSDDKDVVPCLTALASFGPVEATKKILPKLRDKCLSSGFLTPNTMPLGGVVAIMTSFAKLGFDPGQELHKVAVKAANPNIHNLRVYQALPFLTALKVDARRNTGREFMRGYTHRVLQLVDRVSFEALPELIHKFSEVPGFLPSDDFLQLLDKVAAIAAPRIDEWNGGHVQR